MWVADHEDDKIYAYLTGSRAWDPSRDFDTLRAAGTRVPRGLWSDGRTMWVADGGDDKIYAYDLGTKARVPARDFDTLTAANNHEPGGLWSDGATMWVSDWGGDKIYAYDLGTKARVPAREFETLQGAGNNIPTGIWSDGATMWVADYEMVDVRYSSSSDITDGIYAYNMPVGTAQVQPGNPVADPAAFDRDPSLEFGRSLFNAGNHEPWGIWSDGTTMWVADATDDKLYAYDLFSKARVPGKDFDGLKAAGNEDPSGIWSDGTTMWVADHEDDKIYAYNLAAKARDPSRDFDTLRAAGTRVPRGLWSDGRTMWVADGGDDKIYAYDLGTKARVPARDFDTLTAANNHEPGGLWSDGATMWVSDWGGDKIYAYDLGTKARVPAREFETLQGAGNNIPTGIWSDGATMWVADYEMVDVRYSSSSDITDGIYAYNMPPELPSPTLPGTAAAVLVSPGAGSLTVSWSAPPGDASGITAYDLRHIRTDADDRVDANWTVVNAVWTGSGPLRYTLTGLDDSVQYDVQVRAVNAVGQGPWSATATGTTGLRSNAPPVFTAVRSIPENATAGYPVGAPFTATDPDGDSLSYSLSGADSRAFSIGRTSGQITLAAGMVLDYETKASYAVTVTATDGGGLSASIAVTIEVAKMEDPGHPSDSCVQSIDASGAAVSGAWTSDCPSANLPESNARYYTFTLSAQREVTITLESDDADTFLNLLSGAGTEGSVLHSNLSRIQETLGAGTYTIEANTLNAGATGSFTLTLSGLGATMPTPGPEPGDGCAEKLTADGEVSGTWAEGCVSETRDGPYARYYSFTLSQEKEVTITLESDDADSYLYLREGDDVRSGTALNAHADDDDAGGGRNAQIQETLPAGTYTVEATTYGTGETGDFTLTISGL